MASFQNITLIGHLGADPELRWTQDGRPTLTMRVAVNDRRKARTGEWQEVTHWWSVTHFGSAAEALARMLQKGSQVAIAGRPDFSIWSAQDGSPRLGLAVVANELRLLAGGRDREEETSPGYAPAPREPVAAGSAPSPRPTPAVAADAGDVDDLPF